MGAVEKRPKAQMGDSQAEGGEKREVMGEIEAFPGRGRQMWDRSDNLVIYKSTGCRVEGRAGRNELGHLPKRCQCCTFSSQILFSTTVTAVILFILVSFRLE